MRINGLKEDYTVGDELKLTCSYWGEEEVVMHWLVNNRRVKPRLVVRYKYHNYIGLKMVIEKRDLNHRNQLLVRCVASKFWFRLQNHKGFKQQQQQTGSSCVPLIQLPQDFIWNYFMCACLLLLFGMMY